VQNNRTWYDEFYWTKIKLPTAANHSIYPVIFHWVVRSLYLSTQCILILLPGLCRVFKRGEWSVSLYACNCFFWTEKVGKHFICCPPQAEKWGGHVPHPPL